MGAEKAPPPFSAGARKLRRFCRKPPAKAGKSAVPQNSQPRPSLSPPPPFWNSTPSSLAEPSVLWYFSKAPKLIPSLLLCPPPHPLLPCTSSAGWPGLARQAGMGLGQLPVRGEAQSCLTLLQAGPGYSGPPLGKGGIETKPSMPWPAPGQAPKGSREDGACQQERQH